MDGRHTLRQLFCVLCIAAFTSQLLFHTSPLSAQDDTAAPDIESLDPETQRLIQLYASIDWKDGPTSVDIGSNAQVALPEGYRYTGRQGAIAWNELTQNPPDETVGILMPSAEGKDWFLAFEFDDVGYVKDDEKADLDADAILSSMQQGTEQSNEFRRSQGWTAIHIDGWIVPPKYDERTNNLVWATKLHDDDGNENANHNIRILGRRGVMTVTLVAGLEEMNEAIEETNQLLNGFEYRSGDKYSEFTSGDKIAQYGLTGLIAGGAAIAAVKTGLFAKLLQLLAKGGKAIILVVIAVLAGLKKLFFGSSSTE